MEFAVDGTQVKRIVCLCRLPTAEDSEPFEKGRVWLFHPEARRTEGKRDRSGPDPTRPVLHRAVPGIARRPRPRHRPGEVGFHRGRFGGVSATLELPGVLSMPADRRTFDIHCVTKWSKLDTEWEGVPVTELMSKVELLPGASHVLVVAEQGFAGQRSTGRFPGRRQSPRLRVRRGAAGTPARMAPAPRRSPSVLLEIGQMGARVTVSRPR